jgi:hypothetical protein
MIYFYFDSYLTLDPMFEIVYKILKHTHTHTHTHTHALEGDNLGSTSSHTFTTVSSLASKLTSLIFSSQVCL